MALKDCIDDVKAAAGGKLTDEQVLQVMEALDARRQARAAERAMLSAEEQLAAAAKELGDEARLAAAIERRNAALNLKKRVARREFYRRAPDLARGVEAKLVGVNTPFAGARVSVDAQGKALRAQFVTGVAADLDRAGLFESARSGALDREWARELFELSKIENGAPGVTGSKEALAIAKVVHNHQEAARQALNRAGAWIGRYDGYITRTSHDPDRLRRAGFDSWRDAILPKLDQARTFEGVDDIDQFLRRAHNALVTGIHLTQEGVQGLKDPAFTGPRNLAKKLSQGRSLHFKDADSWLDYHRQFGGGNLIEAVLRGLDRAADSIALMREFGTNPRAEFEADLRALAEETRDADMAAVSRLRDLRPRLENEFAQLDGTAQMPVHRVRARIFSGIRAVVSMAKLGGVLLSSINDLGNAAAELRYNGVGFLEGYRHQLAGILEGRGTGDRRELARVLRVGFDGFVRNLATRFDGADTVPGRLSKIQNTFFRLTGLAYWTDAQKNAAAEMLAFHLARHAGTALDALPEGTRRILGLYAIDAAQWDMIRSAEMVEAGGVRYLTPDIAERVDEGAIERHLRATGALEEDAPASLVARRVAAFREDLGLRLAAYLTDRADFAVITPGARERALMFGSSRPGDWIGEAVRSFLQFKAFPVSVVTKAWGREIHGGQGGFGAVAGTVHMLAAATAFGYLAMTAKDLAKGRSPRDPTDPKTWGAAFTQGGGAGIYGDFLFGEFNRFGQGAIATLGGPMVGTTEDVLRLLAQAREGEPRAAAALRLAINNTPFINLFYTRWALDYLLLYQLQEAMSPGFLRRFERRVERDQGQRFLLKPSEDLPYRF